MKKSINITFILLRFALGAMMIYGGIAKFKRANPIPSEMISLEPSEKSKLLENVKTLKIKNYIFGMKQTGFAWEFVGIIEIIGGALLITQLFSLLGALILLPVTTHIFLFHLMLEPDEINELILVFIYFVLNCAFIIKEFRLIKTLIKIKIW